METLSLLDLKAFHADLLSVASAGIPMNLEFDSTHPTISSTGAIDSLTEILHKIENNLAAATANGRSVDEALESDSTVSQQYLAGLHLWHQTGRSPLAFEPMVGATRTGRARWDAFRISMVSPLIWVIASYCALVYVCMRVAPRFADLSEQMWVSPGFALSTLLTIRGWMPVWIPLVPLIVLIVVMVLRRKNASRPSAEGTGMRAYTGFGEAVRRAHLAEYTSNLIEHGVSAEAAIEALRRSVRPTGTGKDRTDLPPVLAWASSQPDSDDSRSTDETVLAESGDCGTRSAMRLATTLYRGIAQVVSQRNSSLDSKQVAFAMLGGVLVLGIALTVFGPLLELLYVAAVPKGS